MIGMFLAVSLLALPLERPVLTHAQGQVESNLNPKAKGKAGEKGAWQVIEKWHSKVHGRVPKTLLAQAKQSEAILNELLADNSNDAFEALIKYNSFKNRKKGIEYAAKVRRRALEVSLIELI